MIISLAEIEKTAEEKLYKGLNNMNENENEIGTNIIASAIKIHRELGPGLLESIYEITLAYELNKQGFNVLRQKPIPIFL